ncbi:MAG TPA: hypothetical protein VGQ71_14980, partial [Terriglobales bacterium]|nr:hypothetical protein [Terriglobales bacterium]
MRHALTLSLSLAFWLVPASWAQEVKPRPDQPPAAAALLPNSDPTYQALRKLGLSGETVSVANLTLKRDAGVFTFRSGTVAFLAPVNGKVTGAVFLGDGSFTLVPPIASEGRVLALLTKEAKLEETFDQVVLRFTDSTYDELKKQPGGTAGAGGSNAASVLNDINNTLREKLNFNLASRISQDVISPRPGGLFVAFIRGKKYSDKMMYILDPQGVPNISPDMMPDWQVAPEEIALTTYEDNKNGVWAAFHLSHEYASGQATGTQKNYVIDIENQQLETSIEKSGKLSGKATTTFVANRDGLSVVPFDLYRTLRVQSVTDAAGTPLHFIQEDKNDDPDFAVVLPKPLAAGERYTITTTYAGKEVVLN